MTIDTVPDLHDLAHQIQHLGAGPKAELKRLDPRRASTWPTTFWDQFSRQVEPGLPANLSADALHERQRTWATILGGMALLEHGASHPGLALAQAGYSDLRLNRLLSARDDRLMDEFRAAIRFLAAKKQAVDWTQFARLILDDPDSSPGDGVRRHLAGTYYRTRASLSH